MSLLYEQTICNTIPPPLFFIQSVYRAPIFPLLSLLLINERPFQRISRRFESQNGIL